MAHVSDPDGARVIRLFALLLCLSGTSLMAQPFPNPDTTLVNDFAGVLDAGAEARIADSLQQLRDDHDIQMTVVTIGSRSDYGEFDSIESFATGMFNAWSPFDDERPNIAVIHRDADGLRLRGEFPFSVDPALR